MKTLVISGIFAALSGLSTSQVQANPMTDVCHIRAEKVSGYSGNRAGLNFQVGRVHFRLSGSVAVGISHSSGPVPANPRAFAGVGAFEQQEARAKRITLHRITPVCRQVDPG